MENSCCYLCGIETTELDVFEEHEIAVCTPCRESLTRNLDVYAFRETCAVCGRTAPGLHPVPRNAHESICKYCRDDLKSKPDEPNFTIELWS